jgi:hypothetical protein
MPRLSWLYQSDHRNATALVCHIPKYPDGARNASLRSILPRRFPWSASSPRAFAIPHRHSPSSGVAGTCESGPQVGIISMRFHALHDTVSRTESREGAPLGHEVCDRFGKPWHHPRSTHRRRGRLPSGRPPPGNVRIPLSHNRTLVHYYAYHTPIRILSCCQLRAATSGMGLTAAGPESRLALS